MSAQKPKIDVLVENIDELYALAQLTEIKMDKPVSELRKAFHIDQHNAAKIGAKMAQSFRRGKPEEIITTVAVLAVSYVCVSAVDLARNTYSKHKAEQALLPIYKQIAVKHQALINQMNQKYDKIMVLLEEEREKNIDNQNQIAVLKAEIENDKAIEARIRDLISKV